MKVTSLDVRSHRNPKTPIHVPHSGLICCILTTLRTEAPERSKASPHSGTPVRARGDVLKQHMVIWATCLSRALHRLLNHHHPGKRRSLSTPGHEQANAATTRSPNNQCDDRAGPFLPTPRPSDNPI